MSLENRLLQKYMPSRKNVVSIPTVDPQPQAQPHTQYQQQPISKVLYSLLAKYPEISPKKGVIHIGAHRCEETELYLSLGIKEEQILWIDGNDDLCSQFPQIINAVISETDDTDVEFIITNNDAMSSSILELKEHKIEHPDCLESQRISKKTVTLDTLFTRMGKEHSTYDLLALDLQGAELLALKGASQVLPHINCIVTEVSIKELYADCVLMCELDAYLENKGFTRIATDMTRHGWGDAIYVRNVPSIQRCLLDNTITVEVNSGLGNRLFQLAFLYGISKEHNVKPLLARNLIKSCSQHFKDQKRYDPFYKMFDIVHNLNLSNANYIYEPKNEPCKYVCYEKEPYYVSNNNLHIFNGYFQSEKFFMKYKSDIVNYFKDALEKTSGDILEKYPVLKHENNRMFIHVRGGDHIMTNNPLHHLTQINSYYEKCLSKVEKSDVYYMIFTDDLHYLNSLKFVNKLKNYSIIQENELDTLYLMSKCHAGGICTNSSFSWWGSYLNNNENKQVFMPFPFLNGKKTRFDDIYYTGVEQVKVDESTVFDDIVMTRFVKNEIIVTIVQKEDTQLNTVLINNKPAVLRKIDKPLHNDIYCTYYIITSSDPKWSSKSSLVFLLNIDGIERQFEVSKTEVKKKDMVAMTMFKNDTELIHSYVTYYTRMGVDHFYMYYNDVKPIQSLPQYPNVTYIQWNYPYYVDNHHHAQIGAITDFLYWSKHFAKYVLYNDMDEYIFWKGPSDLTLKQFVLNNKFPCYGFLNCFVYLKAKNAEIEPCDNLYKFIEDGDFVRTTRIYEWERRSKCIVDPKHYDAVGVHKTISPSDKAKCVFDFATAGIYHVVNVKDRDNVSITKNCLKGIK